MKSKVKKVLRKMVKLEQECRANQNNARLIEANMQKMLELGKSIPLKDFIQVIKELEKMREKGLLS